MDLKDLLIDSFIDTLKVFIVVFVVYIIFSFIESKLVKKIENNNKYSPLIGASIGLIPQCGFSIVSADLYRKKYISIGTLIAIFIACSDEALPVLLSHPDKIIMIIPLLVSKFIIAVTFGYLIDFIYKKQEIKAKHNHNNLLIHSGCCNHEIEQNHESNIQKHLLHPLIHTLKICAYVLIVNIIFSLLIYYIGNDNISNFLDSNVYLTPLLAGLVGLIPNCASSVIITELFSNNILTFAATISGLSCNAGLGIVFLFKDKSKIKNSLLITGILLTIAIVVGYIILPIELLIGL